MGTISGHNVLNWNLKIAVGDNLPCFCTQLEPQVLRCVQIAPIMYTTGPLATCFRLETLDRSVVLPNSCTSIGLLHSSRVGQCAAGVQNGRCCTSIGLLHQSRSGLCAAYLPQVDHMALTEMDWLSTICPEGQPYLLRSLLSISLSEAFVFWKRMRLCKPSGLTHFERRWSWACSVRRFLFILHLRNSQLWISYRLSK